MKDPMPTRREIEAMLARVRAQGWQPRPIYVSYVKYKQLQKEGKCK